MRFSLNFLLYVALICFALDWLHVFYHLIDEPVLWEMGKVPAKILLKTLALGVVLFLLFRRRLGFKLFAFLCVFFIWNLPTSYADNKVCQEARQLMEKSGVSRDASENMFGKVKIKPPHGSFPEEMDKITWWGDFKPFELWGNPEFQAVWINPNGDEVANQKFRGNKCRLAKTTIMGEDQPKGRFQGGMWKVIVTCEDYLIDRQSFAVMPSGKSQSAYDATQNEGSMIWAEDMLGDKK